MDIPLKDLPAYLKNLQRAAANASTPAANAMASGFQDRVQNVTLKKAGHAPYTFYRAVPGQPPAYASGRLARSIVMQPAHGTIRSTATVGSHLVYSAIQEWGGWTEPRRAKYMHWRNPTAWWKKHVDIPEHPYMRPTVEAMFRDGTLTRLAADSFYARVRTYFSG